MIKRGAFFIVCSGKSGGAERRFLYLFEHMATTGRDVHLISNSEYLDDKSDLKLRFGDRIFSSNLCRFGVVSKFLFVVTSIAYLMRKDIGYVHFCVNPSPYSLLYSLLSYIFGYKIGVSIVNSTRKGKSDFTKLEMLAWRVSLKRARFIDFLSPSIKKNVLNVFPDSIDMVRSQISPNSFSRFVDYKSKEFRNNTIGRDIDFLFASRMVVGKGVDLLIQALIRLDGYGKPFNVYVVGDGPLGVKFEALKLRNIDLSTPGYLDDISELLSRTKFALSLQEFENYPSQFLLEALMMRCNIIVTDVGDTRLLLNDNVAFFTTNNPDDLSFLMSNSNYFHDSVREERVINILSEHNVERFSKYFEHVLLEL